MKFGATILDAEGVCLTADEKALFRASNPFGFILFSRNVENADQVRALCAEMRDAVGRDAPILVDQEGGRVQRLREPLAREWSPPMEFMFQAGENAERAAWLRYRIIAAELRALGIDANCAPTADIAYSDTHPFLRDRCLGDSVAPVVARARACAQGLIDGGVLPVLKHIPGHGRATRDSHEGLPRVSESRETLFETDFAVFAALADIPMGMTAHVVYETVDSLPCTLSPAVLETVRDKIGFGGLLMTDDLSMGALEGERPKLARAALDAGCDVAMMCNRPLAERAAFAEACGEMADLAQARAESVILARIAPDSIDISDCEEELAGLVAD